jgi:hypothetical protein
MSKEHGLLGLLALCVITLILSFAGLIADFATRLIGNIDGLLLLMISLMMAGLFFGVLYSIAKEEGWLPARRRAAEAAPAQPKAQASPVSKQPAAEGK